MSQDLFSQSDASAIQPGEARVSLGGYRAAEHTLIESQERGSQHDHRILYFAALELKATIRLLAQKTAGQPD